MTCCSFCKKTALYMGAGQDGDFYCQDHMSMAWNGLIDIRDL